MLFVPVLGIQRLAFDRQLGYVTIDDQDLFNVVFIQDLVKFVLGELVAAHVRAVHQLVADEQGKDYPVNPIKVELEIELLERGVVVFIFVFIVVFHVRILCYSASVNKYFECSSLLRHPKVPPGCSIL